MTTSSTLRRPTLLRRIVGRHPLTTFFVLTYALSWWAAPLTDGKVLAHGPAIAAVVVLAISRGRPGLSGLWRQMKHWRVGWRWYLIASGIIATYLLAGVLVSLALGATINGSEAMAIGALAALIFELLLLGGLWEEPGWSGYSLPALQARYAGRRHGLLKASLVMGILRGLWHVPLVIYGFIPWFDALFFSMAFQLILTWLYNRTEGSLPVVMLAHLTSNVVGGGIVLGLFTGSDRTTYYVAFIAMAGLMALLLNSRNGWSMGKREEPVMAPSATR